MSAEIDRAQLARILGMLGSHFEGEVLAAPRQAERLRRDARMSWADIVLPALPPPDREPADFADVSEAIAFCRQHPHVLTAWEATFLASVAKQRRLSAKQLGVLRRILEKCRAAAGAAA